jgi:hypothetical protein
VKSFKDEMARLFILSIAVFFFILFFQPFPLHMLDFNNRLLYVTGFGAIYFLLSWLIFILLPLSITKWFNISEWESGPPIILVIVLLGLTTTAFAFYIRYVGKVPLSMYIVFKIILVCLLPLIVLKMMYKMKTMEKIIIVLQEENKSFLAKILKEEKHAGEEEFEVISENKSEKLILKFKNIVLVKSADNYIEIFYFDNEIVERKLVRNTLKGIELQLTLHKRFVRCHRTRIVNIHYIEKLLRDFSGYYLKMNCCEEKVPVSRQFLAQLKEAISNKK